MGIMNAPLHGRSKTARLLLRCCASATYRRAHNRNSVAPRGASIRAMTSAVARYHSAGTVPNSVGSMRTVRIDFKLITGVPLDQASRSVGETLCIGCRQEHAASAMIGAPLGCHFAKELNIGWACNASTIHSLYPGGEANGVARRTTTKRTAGAWRDNLQEDVWPFRLSQLATHARTGTRSSAVDSCRLSAMLGTI